MIPVRPVVTYDSDRPRGPFDNSIGGTTMDELSHPTEAPTNLGHADVLAQTGVTYRQLDYWERRGYVTSSPAARRGSGHSRLWPLAEVDVIRRMVALTGAGIAPHLAAFAARHPAGTVTLLPDGGALIADWDAFRARPFVNARDPQRYMVP